MIWPDAGDAVLVGRNMDFHRDLMTNLWKQPRGVTRDDGVAGKLTWTSTFGSVIATAFDIISSTVSTRPAWPGTCCGWPNPPTAHRMTPGPS